MKEKRVVVNDKMQRGYVYHRSEPVGRNFAPNFRPEREPGDRECRRRQRQAVLHWAYDSRTI